MKPERLQIIEDCLSDIQGALETLQEVHDEEEEAYDNLPESLQDGEKGDMMQDAIDALDNALFPLEDVISSLEEVTTNADNELVMEIDPWQQLSVGDEVAHKSFGKGIITVIKGKYYTIAFGAKESVFIFPDAIDKGFITI